MGIIESGLRIQYGKEQWRSLFGCYWSPKDYAAIQALQLTNLKLHDWEVREIIAAYGGAVEHSLCMGIAIGWVVAMVVFGIAAAF